MQFELAERFELNFNDEHKNENEASLLLNPDQAKVKAFLRLKILILFIYSIQKNRS
mgnify:FL=1